MNGSCSHPDAPVDRHRKHDSIVVIHMLAKQVKPPRRGDDNIRLAAKSISKLRYHVVEIPNRINLGDGHESSSRECTVQYLQERLAACAHTF